MKKVELLAPAGSFESFLGAVHAGADAVYIGGQKYGARAYAENFTQEEVCLAIRYAHLFGKKLYLTVNTLVKEDELKELPAYIAPFYEEGLDGVIVQDMGVFSLLRGCFPQLALHGSTQMTVTGARGARFLLEQGASRVVPARELSLEEIIRIKDTGIEVEAFIHGAMCYCYSGQCLFSSMLGGRSGNRGRCAQPCRLPYQVLDKEGYPLSLKDMCTLTFLPELIEAGIDSFKIEGRMKKPEYAAGVTALYRKYIDRYYASFGEDFTVEKEDMEKLRTLYIRSEIQEGYYHRHNGREMITLDKPSYLGLEEGYLKEIRKAYLEQPPKILVNGKLILRKECPVQLELVRAAAQSRDKTEGMPLQGTSVSVKGQIAEAAQKQPLTEETVRKQIEKTGNTPFAFQKLTVYMDQDVFLPVKALNELRRAALEKLEEQLTAGSRREMLTSQLVYEASEADAGHCVQEMAEKDKKTRMPYLSVQIQQKEQLTAVQESEAVDRIYLDADLLLDYEEEIQNVLSEWKNKKSDRALFLVMPAVIRLSDEAYLQRFYKAALSDMVCDGVLVRNLESLQWLKEQKYSGKIIADAGLYTWNRQAKEFFKGMQIALTAPLECNKEEWHKLGLMGMEVIVYGRAPLMITANCIRKTMLQCLGNKKEEKNDKLLREKRQLRLRDRYKTEFPVRAVCGHCYNEIYNSVPLSLHEYGKSVMGEQPAGVRLIFTTETLEEVQQVLTCYADYLTKPEKKRQAEFLYTKGHYKRGAE